MGLISLFNQRAKKHQDYDWPAWFAFCAEQVRHPILRRFYARGVIDGDTPLADVPFVAMDFETTGLDVKRDGILSIGLVPFNLQRIRVNETRHWLLNPQKPLSEESVVIHGITHSDIEGEEDVKGIIRPLLTMLSGCIPVVHYRAIERSFLDAAFKAQLGDGIMFPVLDTMDIEAGICRPQRQGLARWFHRRNPVSVRLGDTRQRYHLPHYTAHHAAVDALATAELLQAQIAHHFSADTPLKTLWC